ncbi:LysR family transcriptional regulator [Lentilactobacillus sp. Marseille-Q4993]|uniref:LysR family transcriptional regulator n=1 Tax=Lentilactobacillus sp. Marseille-Q4993 TaxID=3039492 RepID=UPI0024BC355F|nr:LysR family transcriptional regulator [Lentilactobacillus sp. Marseille-Q4993]
MLDNKYFTFWTLYETKSFTKTAEKLFITQPAVSQQIKALQSELKMDLVTYSHSRLSFTSQGVELANLIRRIDIQTQQRIREIAAPGQPKSLSFGSTLSMNEVLEPQFIESISNDYAKINCKVANTEAILKDISAGELEFGLVEGNFDRHNFDSLLLGQDQFVGVCAADHPFHNQTVTIDECLANRLLVREPGSGSRFIFENWLNGQNHHLDDFFKVIAVGDIRTLQQLLNNNQGISFMYQSAINSLPKQFNLKTFKLVGFDITHDLNIVYLPNSPKISEVERFANLIRPILSNQTKA